MEESISVTQGWKGQHLSPGMPINRKVISYSDSSGQKTYNNNIKSVYIQNRIKRLVMIEYLVMILDSPPLFLHKKKTYVAGTH